MTYDFERADAQAERNRRRAHNCDKCGAAWSLRKALGKDLPASMQDSVFQAVRYDYCGACGNARPRKI